MRKILMNKEQRNYVALRKRMDATVAKAKGIVDEKYLDMFNESLKELDELVEFFKGLMAGGKFLNIFAQATPFQEAMYMVSIAWMHVWTLTICQPKMKELVGDAKGADRDKLLADNNEAAFYTGKVLSSQFYLGSIYRMKKDYDNAIAMLENSKNDRRFLIGSLYMLAEMSFENEDYAGAIDYLEKGLNSLKENDDESLDYRYLLAECYENENKIKEAVHHWTKIEAENPNYRSTKIKLEAYRTILGNVNLMQFFQNSLEELQPYIRDIIAGLNFNIVNAERLSMNEYIYKTYNIKRINDPPMLVCFNKTTREISEGQIIDFYKRINNEKCKGGIYIATSKFSLRAKASASSKMIELYESDFVSKAMEKINARKKGQK